MINVIIPVFNGSQTIKRTLASLVAQNARKFIVTVVDDCSTDDTIEIVQSFQKMIPIRIIELPENKGVGNARQVGLDTNECDYVCFLDADDMFMPYTINLYNREMRNDDIDVLYCDFISEQTGKEVLLEGKSNITWLHGKCYKKAFLDKYSIRFPQIRYNEDSGFSTIIHELAEKKAHVPEIAYIWSENKNSLTRSSTDFNINSMPHFTRAIQYAFHHINEHKEVQKMPVFYGQLNNLYAYYMDAIFNEKPFVPEFKIAIQEFLREFWIEDKIRPNLLVYSFNLKSPITNCKSLNTMTHVQWLNDMMGTTYEPTDFKLDEVGENKE